MHLAFSPIKGGAVDRPPTTKASHPSRHLGRGRHSKEFDSDTVCRNCRLDCCPGFNWINSNGPGIACCLEKHRRTRSRTLPNSSQLGPGQARPDALSSTPTGLRPPTKATVGAKREAVLTQALIQSAWSGSRIAQLSRTWPICAARQRRATLTEVSRRLAKQFEGRKTSGNTGIAR